MYIVFKIRTLWCKINLIDFFSSVWIYRLCVLYRRHSPVFFFICICFASNFNSISIVKRCHAIYGLPGLRAGKIYWNLSGEFFQRFSRIMNNNTFVARIWYWSGIVMTTRPHNQTKWTKYTSIDRLRITDPIQCVPNLLLIFEWNEGNLPFLWFFFILYFCVGFSLFIIIIVVSYLPDYIIHFFSCCFLLLIVLLWIFFCMFCFSFNPKIPTTCTIISLIRNKISLHLHPFTHSHTRAHMPDHHTTIQSEPDDDLKFKWLVKSVCFLFFLSFSFGPSKRAHDFLIIFFFRNFDFQIFKFRIEFYSFYTSCIDLFRFYYC